MWSRAHTWGAAKYLILIGIGIGLAGCVSTQAPQFDRLLGQTSLAPPTTVQRPDLDSKTLIAAIQAGVDSVRRAHERAPLEWSDAIAQVAASHSADMARHEFFSHTSPDGLDPNDRARAANLRTRMQAGGYLIDGLGENLFLAHLYHSYAWRQNKSAGDGIHFSWKTSAELAHEAVNLWMESPEHRKNLVSPLYRSGGIGVAFGGNETVFVTCNFSVVDSATLAAN